jgi:hypothetical protein
MAAECRHVTPPISHSPGWLGVDAFLAAKPCLVRSTPRLPCPHKRTAAISPLVRLTRPPRRRSPHRQSRIHDLTFQLSQPRHARCAGSRRARSPPQQGGPHAGPHLPPHPRQIHARSKAPAARHTRSQSHAAARRAPASQRAHTLPTRRQACDKSGVRPARIKAGVRPARIKAGVRPARIKAGVRPARIKAGVRPARIKAGVRPARTKAGVRPARTKAGVPPASDADCQGLRTSPSSSRTEFTLSPCTHATRHAPPSSHTTLGLRPCISQGCEQQRHWAGGQGGRAASREGTMGMERWQARESRLQTRTSQSPTPYADPVTITPPPAATHRTHCPHPARTPATRRSAQPPRRSHSTSPPPPYPARSLSPVTAMAYTPPHCAHARRADRRQDPSEPHRARLFLHDANKRFLTFSRVFHMPC